MVSQTETPRHCHWSLSIEQEQTYYWNQTEKESLHWKSNQPGHRNLWYMCLIKWYLCCYMLLTIFNAWVIQILLDTSLWIRALSSATIIETINEKWFSLVSSASKITCKWIRLGLSYNLGWGHIGYDNGLSVVVCCGANNTPPDRRTAALNTNKTVRMTHGTTADE